MFLQPNVPSSTALCLKCQYKSSKSPTKTLGTSEKTYLEIFNKNSVHNIFSFNLLLNFLTINRIRLLSAGLELVFTLAIRGKLSIIRCVKIWNPIFIRWIRTGFHIGYPRKAVYNTVCENMESDFYPLD